MALFYSLVLGVTCSLVPGAFVQSVTAESEECRKHLTEIADSDSSFELCALLNARPFQVCRNCHDDYSAAYTLFINLQMERGAIAKNCSSELLSGDRVSIINRDFEHLKETWKASYCDNCFYRQDTNDTVHFTESPSTQGFFNRSDNLLECIDTQLDNKTNICSACSFKFDQLSDYYNVLVEQTKGVVCMDITDQMNRTRVEWSGYGCTHIYPLSYDVYATVAIIIILTFIFYLSARLSQKPMDTEIVTVHTIQRTLNRQHSSERRHINSHQRDLLIVPETNNNPIS